MCGHWFRNPRHPTNRMDLTKGGLVLKAAPNAELRVSGVQICHWKRLTRTLGGFLETQQVNALLCHYCDGKLQKFSVLKDEICKKVSCLHRIDSSNPGNRQPGQKRVCVSKETGHTKRLRVDDGHVSEDQQQPPTSVALEHDASPPRNPSHCSNEHGTCTQYCGFSA